MDPTAPITPTEEPDDGLNMSGMTDNLQNFLQKWCDDAVSPDAVARMLHSPDGAQYAGWLENEFKDAYMRGVLTPGFLAVACRRDFRDQQAIADWLLSVWPSWFDKPFGADPIQATTQTQQNYQQQPTQQVIQPQYQQPQNEVQQQVVQPQYQQSPNDNYQQPPQPPVQPGAPQNY